MASRENRGKRSVIAWCLYDAASSAFSTVIVTFIFSVYFARGIYGDETQGSAVWSYAMAASGVIVALLGPLCGAVADHYGARKPGLIFFSAFCILPTALLYFMMPSPAFILPTLALIIVANTGFELTQVYSNAMLPHLARPEKIGRISGWAWGAGYAGGLACLVLALVLLVGIGDFHPLLRLPQEHAEHLRAVAPLVALWFVLLSIPLLLWTHDTKRTGLSIGRAGAEGLRQLLATLRAARTQKNLALFLVSSAIYRDGLNTMFAVGGLYAAGTFGMSFTEILLFAIGLNVAAALGATLFAFADDAVGSKKTVMIALAGLVLTGVAILLAREKLIFVILALALGIFIGPAQSASRTLAARLSHPERIAQTYGLYAFTGECVSPFGPLIFGLATSAFDSQRAGMATIIALWLAGMALLAFVKEKRA